MHGIEAAARAESRRFPTTCQYKLDALGCTKIPSSIGRESTTITENCVPPAQASSRTF